MPLGVEVLIDQETLRRMVLSSLDYYTHHISPHTIPPKMTKLSSKLNLTKLFYISQQQNLYPPQKFPNSPGNYHNHNPTSESDQETITIIDPTRLALKIKLFTASHSSLPG